MKKFLFAIILFTGISAMMISEAEARRFGGGSFGRQSQNVGRMAPAQRAQPAQPNRQAAQNQQSQQGAAAQAPGRSGIVGGLLMGLGLGALLAHLGIGGHLAGFIGAVLMVALVVIAAKMVFRLIARRQEPAFHPVSGPQIMQRESFQDTPVTNTPQIGSGISDPASTSGVDGKPFTWDIPGDFELNAFLRSAKAYYIRLQAAWDKSNIDDIHEFTTPEMFAEMKLQLKERGTEPNVTDVVSIEAELLGIETIGNEYFASVKFTGTVRENEHAELADFTEVWNFTRPVSEEEGWVLAGVQQVY
jgi:predicted lipid-binding transport protein (Tim44 family)